MFCSVLFRDPFCFSNIDRRWRWWHLWLSARAVPFLLFPVAEFRDFSSSYSVARRWNLADVTRRQRQDKDTRPFRAHRRKNSSKTTSHLHNLGRSNRQLSPVCHVKAREILHRRRLPLTLLSRFLPPFSRKKALLPKTIAQRSLFTRLLLEFSSKWRSQPGRTEHNESIKNWEWTRGFLARSFPFCACGVKRRTRETRADRNESQLFSFLLLVTRFTRQTSSSLFEVVLSVLDCRVVSLSLWKSPAKLTRTCPYEIAVGPDYEHKLPE